MTVYFTWIGFPIYAFLSYVHEIMKGDFIILITGATTEHRTISFDSGSDTKLY